MQTTTITAPDSRSALNRVMDVLGPDAVIIQTRKTRGGVEVVAGVERRMPPIAPQALKPRHDPMVRFIAQARARSEEHTSELPSLMRNSYAVFCLNKKITI